jgi:nucleolar protein 9
MPKERKHKGRREDQKKRKREHDDDAASPKRSKNEHIQSVEEESAYQHDDAAAVDVTRPDGGLTFYGMLDDDEQEYFKRADEMLELNQFEDPEARTLFLESVYKEADGKELKIANSQSCSRLLERLILLSSPEQLKGLFQKFSGQ